jgi:DNA-binding transcriptional MerR regulator
MNLAKMTMAEDKGAISTENDFRILLFMRLWKSKGGLALSTVRELTKRSESRKIRLPEIHGRDIKSELAEMRDKLSILVDRLE